MPPTGLARVSSTKKGAHLEFQNARVEIDRVGPSIFRVGLAVGDARYDASFALVDDKKPIAATDVVIDDVNVTVRIDEYAAVIRRDTGAIRFTNENGSLLRDVEAPFQFDGQSILVSKLLRPDEHFFGLGEKTGWLDKRGREYTMWNSDIPYATTTDPLYVSIPFTLGYTGGAWYGVFVDYPGRIEFDLGSKQDEYWSFRVHHRAFRYYLVCGTSPREIVETFTELTGRSPMPPAWALGYHQSRWSYFPDDEVRSLVKEFRAREIPLDVFHLDIDYMDGYRVFTWDPRGFSDPAALVSDLAAQDVRIVTIVDPGVKKDPEYSVYAEGLADGHFCAELDGTVYHGEVWPGTAAFPDFTQAKTRKWWAEKHAALFDAGVAGIWNDMNEPSDFSQPTKTVPNDLVLKNDDDPRSFREAHNYYGSAMATAARQAFEAHSPRKRAFVLTRAGYAGVQRVSAVWTGDNASTWEHLAMSIPMMVNLGLSGVPIVGSDVGGFAADATGELFARWIEAACLTPFFRCHSAIRTRRQEPWAFGRRIEDVARKYISMRYTFLPYLYTKTFEAHTTGTPIMRPLFLEFPDDPGTLDINDEYMIGHAMLVAPVVRPGARAREVYLPPGGWFEWSTGVYYEGASHILADAPLSSLPLFVRAGSIIPTVAPAGAVSRLSHKTITLDVFPRRRAADENGSTIAEGTLYQDDGETNDYLDGKRRVMTFALDDTPTGLKFTFATTEKAFERTTEHLRLRIHHESIAEADAKGATVQSTRTIEGIAEIELDITERGEVTLKRIESPPDNPSGTAIGG